MFLDGSVSQIYSEGAVQTGLNEQGCQVDSTLSFYVIPPTGGTISVDQLSYLELIDYADGFFTYDLTSDDNKNPTQFPAGNYTFEACSANCVSFSMNVPQNPVTSATGCSSSGIGNPTCNWYARDKNTITGHTTTYDHWGGQLWGPNFDNSLESDRIIANMVVSTDNTPGDSGAIYQWVGAALNNPPPGSGNFVQVGIKYQGSGVYDGFFYTNAPVSGMCTGTGTTFVAPGECDHPISPNTSYTFDMHTQGTIMYVGINGVPFAEYTIPAHQAEQGMSAFYTIGELQEVDTNMYQATLNGHTPFSSTFYPALAADFRTNYIDYEASDGVTDYQFNGLAPFEGIVSAPDPMSGAYGTQTGGKMDCGAVGIKTYADFGGGSYTEWWVGVRTSLSNHC